MNGDLISQKNKNMFILVGGHPKGFDEPFHNKTKSGKILRKILGEPNNTNFMFFDLWNNQEDQDIGIVGDLVLSKLKKFIKNKDKIIALGRFTEKALCENNIECLYLPHPASRRVEDKIKLEKSLKD
jgi:hypothetical protein